MDFFFLQRLPAHLSGISVDPVDRSMIGRD
jgi:hypothetical protein